MLAALTRADVDYVLIGGVAVAAHGYVRATEDLDLVPDPSRANLERLMNGLVVLDAHLRSGQRMGERERQALRRGRNLTVLTSVGALDIVQRLTGVPPYEQLRDAATTTDVLGMPVRICSLAHLREMKAARAGHQDLADLENLPAS